MPPSGEQLLELDNLKRALRDSVLNKLPVSLTVEDGMGYEQRLLVEESYREALMVTLRVEALAGPPRYFEVRLKEVF